MFAKAVCLLGVFASTIAFSLAQKQIGCRVAVCFSGAIRSFVHPVVHNSIRVNLIDAIEADGCEVDVFAYVTRKDKVGRGKKVSYIAPGYTWDTTHGQKYACSLRTTVFL